MACIKSCEYCGSMTCNADICQTCLSAILEIRSFDKEAVLKKSKEIDAAEREADFKRMMQALQTCPHCGK